MGHFCPPGSGSGFWIRIRIHWPDRIRIQFGSGSATLKNTKILWSGSGSCQPWIWDPGWKKWDPESWIWDVYPGSGILDLWMGCLSWIRNVYPGSATLILALKILKNAIMKCEDLIKNIQMAFNFVTLLIYPLHFLFMGVFNFVIQKPSVNKQEQT